MSEKLWDLLNNRADAAAKLMRELAVQFPKGTRVAFMIMHNQQNPSTGVVTGYRDGGYLRIKHAEAKTHSRYLYRKVFFADVVKIT